MAGIEVALETTAELPKPEASGVERLVMCNWEIPEGYDDIFFTDCGHNMMFDHGFPKEKGFIFCPWCGNKLGI